MRRIVLASIAAALTLAAVAKADASTLPVLQILLPFREPCWCAMLPTHDQMTLRAAPQAFRNQMFPIDPHGFYNVYYEYPGIVGGLNAYCPIGDQFPAGSNPAFPGIAPDLGQGTFLTWWPAIKLALNKTYEASCWAEVQKVAG
jgi:hypothetical protein